jgi:hypothetical protein
LLDPHLKKFIRFVFRTAPIRQDFAQHFGVLRKLPSHEPGMNSEEFACITDTMIRKSEYPMKLKTGRFILAMLATALSTSACKEETDDKKPGQPLNVPEVEPPFSRNLPEGLSLVNFKLEDVPGKSNKEIALDALKTLIAPDGDFVGVKQRLQKIDERMAELDKRAQESQKACLAEGVTAKDFDLGASLPGDQDLVLKLQCQEDLDDKQQLAFGLTDDSFYLTERHTGNGLTVLASAPKDGTSISAWQIGASADATTAIQIYAKDGEGLEATIAGTDTSGKSGAAPCGLHIRAKGELVYMKASLAVANGCSADEEFCVAASSFEDKALTECTAAGLDTLSLTRLTPALVEAVKTDLRTALTRKISGFIDFTKDAEVPAE